MGTHELENRERGGCFELKWCVMYGAGHLELEPSGWTTYMYVCTCTVCECLMRLTRDGSPLAQVDKVIPPLCHPVTHAPRPTILHVHVCKTNAIHVHRYGRPAVIVILEL